MNNLSWYTNIYYKFRQYPIAELNSKYKTNELRMQYSLIFKKLFSIFQIENGNELNSNSILNQNNYELMMNKRAETYLAEQKIEANHLDSLRRDSLDSSKISQRSNSYSKSKSPHEIFSEVDSEDSIIFNQINKINPSRKNSQSKFYIHPKVSKNVSKTLPLPIIMTENMDVFFQLMIKMIRTSLKRLTVEAFAINKYGKFLHKKLNNELHKSNSQTEVWKEKFEKIFKDEVSSHGNVLNQHMIQIVVFPPTLEEAKFQFLRHAIQAKLYNDPEEVHLVRRENVKSLKHVHSSESFSSNSNSNSNQSSSSSVSRSSQENISESHHKDSHVEEGKYQNNLDKLTLSQRLLNEEIKLKAKNLNAKSHDSFNEQQFEKIILKASLSETTIYNKIITIYINSISNTNSHQVQIINFKNIAESIFQMGSGQFLGFKSPLGGMGIKNTKYRKYIFDDHCELPENSKVLSNTNILLSTWLELILFNESPETLFDLISEMVKHESDISVLLNDITTPAEKEKSNGNRRSAQKSNLNASQQPFYDKLISYLHLLILDSTKNIFLQSLCKINFLMIILTDVIGDNEAQNSNCFLKPYSQICVKKYEELDPNTQKTLNVYQNLMITYDDRDKKQLWKKQAIQLLLIKWKIIANVLTEVCIQNKKAFFVSIFENCTKLLDKQLGLQIDLVQKVMAIVENASFYEQKQQRQGERDGNNLRRKSRGEYVKFQLQTIVQEIIGFESMNDGGTTSSPSSSSNLNSEASKMININKILYGHSHQKENKYKESTFANREENTEELSKWSQILNQNIYIYQKYIQCLDLITTLFKNDPIYIGLWFEKFHEEVKILMKRTERQKLENIFKKFIEEIPALWQNLTMDKKRFNKPKISKERSQSKPRTRLSSIKEEKKLGLKDKKALILNYMLKAQLELYSQHKLVEYLNLKSDPNDQVFLLSDRSNSPNASNPMEQVELVPNVFENQLIKNLLLFSIQDHINQFSHQQNVEQIDTNEMEDEVIFKRSKLKHSTHILSFEKKTYQNEAIAKRINTMNSIGSNKNEENRELEKIMKILSTIEKSMSIELNLKENWKERCNESEVELVGELYDHIRYLNQINFSYEHWMWNQNLNSIQIETQNTGSVQANKHQHIPNQNSFKKEFLKSIKDIKLLQPIQYLTGNKQVIPKFQLLNSRELNEDIEEIQRIFKEIEGNEKVLPQMTSNLNGKSGQSEKIILKKYELDEIVKKLKSHNKELYLILESIIEGQNYYKLINQNIIGREKNYQFRKILEDFVLIYQDQKKQLSQPEKINKLNQPNHHDNLFSSLKNKKTFKDQTQDQLKHASKSNSISSLTNKLMEKMMHGNLQSQNDCEETFITRFQYAPEYYKIKSKILRVNGIISSLSISNEIYKNIKNSKVLSAERFEKLKIIGTKYYDCIEELNANDMKNNHELISNIHAGSLHQLQNVYQCKLIIILISLVNLTYDSESDCKAPKPNYYKTKSSKQYIGKGISEKDIEGYKETLKSYSEVIKLYFQWRIRENCMKLREKDQFEIENSKPDNEESSQCIQNQFNLLTLVKEVCEIPESGQYCNEDTLVQKLEELLKNNNNAKFSTHLLSQINRLKEKVSFFASGQQKIEYLRKQLAYNFLREIYFTISYDNDIFSKKEFNSKRNYQIYQHRINNFFEEIIQVDHQEFVHKKQSESKKRSIHLKNYEFKYVEEPQIQPIEKNINKLICCVFNQILTLFTQEQMIYLQRKSDFKQKHRIIPHEDFYQYYCSADFRKQNLSLQKGKSIKNIKSLKTLKSLKGHEKVQKEMDSQQSISPIQNIFGAIFGTQDINTEKDLNIDLKVDLPNKIEKRSRIYSTDNFYLVEGLKFYHHMQKQFISKLKYLKSNTGCRSIRLNPLLNSTKAQALTEMELQIFKNNEASLISMLKLEMLSKINQEKCRLLRKNMISKIERLYINLDVRHKVFESFKDKILNYEMQKAKIYHQYMDYIRGLKLDVYAHIAGEESFPYIKIVNAVKLYRLSIKKQELETRVNQEFEKNLQKWNTGIQKNLLFYQKWIDFELQQWNKTHTSTLAQKIQLLSIYGTVNTELQRQCKTRHYTNDSLKKKNPDEQISKQEENKVEIVQKQQSKCRVSFNFNNNSKQNQNGEKNSLLFKRSSAFLKQYEKESEKLININKDKFSKATQKSISKNKVRNQAFLKKLSIKENQTEDISVRMKSIENSAMKVCQKQKQKRGNHNNFRGISVKYNTRNLLKEQETLQIGDHEQRNNWEEKDKKQFRETLDDLTKIKSTSMKWMKCRPGKRDESGEKISASKEYRYDLKRVGQA